MLNFIKHILKRNVYKITHLNSDIKLKFHKKNGNHFSTKSDFRSIIYLVFIFFYPTYII